MKNRITPITAISMKRRLSIVASGVHGGHRIMAARIQRMAAADSAQGEPAAARGAMRLHRLQRVLRTTRMKAAARPQQRAEHALVGAYQEDYWQNQKRAHQRGSLCQCWARL